MVERNVSELPIDYRANKKIELAKKLINAENLKLHGITQDSKIAGELGDFLKVKFLMIDLQQVLLQHVEK